MIDKAARVARAAKHELWLGLRQARARGQLGLDAAHRLRARKGLPLFTPAAHARKDGTFPLDYFLNRIPDEEFVTVPTPRRLFTAWTGINPMSENRARSLASIEAHQTDVRHVHITPENLHEWVVDGHPLHPAYDLLTEVHRSDYLRAYLLHHHGGGWSDIKPTRTSWSPFFARFDDDDLWLLGCPEISSTHPAYMETPVGAQLRRYHAHIVANIAFIARPRTPFTAAWLEEVESRLDYYHRALRRHPAQDPFGETGHYPIPWSQIMGEVFQPLQLVYAQHTGLEPAMRPETVNFR